MKRIKIRLLALILAAAMLLSGCTMDDLGEYAAALQSAVTGESDVIPFSDMEYEHPDLTEIRTVLEETIQIAQSADADLETVVNAIYSFYDTFDWFYTCSALADIHYSADLTDIYWEKEYTYCQDHAGEVDAMLEELYYALADSPHRTALEAEEYFGDGYFDSYDGENLWDETFVALLEAESELQSRYYALSTQALDFVPDTEEYYDAVADDMAQLLVELISLRKEIAAYWGYTDYVEFANDFYYYRDFTPSEMAAYLEQIRIQLVPVYLQIQPEDWDAYYQVSTEQDTFDYVHTAAREMGGLVEEAFDLLKQGGLYDIGYGENKYSTSFEIYLTSYWEPFIFLNPTMTHYDWLTFAHEFGHFCNDYASYGSYAGTDVLEFFSQGMEYLSLCYSKPEEALVRMKMADSLCVYVEQAAYAAFELQMYTLPEENLSADGLYALYEQIAQDYGFESIGYDRREFVAVPHFFTNPLYVFSYVISNDAALQLYQMEQETSGAGLRCFEDNLDTQEAYFLSFLDSAELESPFAPGRVDAVTETFESFFGK